MKNALRTLGLCIAAIPWMAAANPPDNVKSDSLKNAVILVIRHAEKPDKGKHLSQAGKARANAYVDYFKNYKVNDKALKLESLFAAADTKGSHRPRLTLESTANTRAFTIRNLQMNSDKNPTANRYSFVGTMGKYQNCSKPLERICAW